MNEIITQGQNAPAFERAPVPSAVNVGAVAIEQERAIAEAQGQLILAKRFPRDLNAAYAEIMESCKHPSMAAVAFYSVPRAGGSVTGPSIRLAEELARVCGNIEYGHRELSRDAGKSEVEVYAWDKQTNTRRIRQITVGHTIDTRNGPKPCRDQKEVDDLIANKASKQMRSLVLSLMPVWLKESAMEECRKTLAGDNKEPLSVKIRGMTQAFAPYGVTVKHLETYLGHALDQTTRDELIDLVGIHNAMKEGIKPSEFFSAQDAEAASAGKVTAADIAKQASQPEGEKKAEPDPVKESPADVLTRIAAELEEAATEAEFMALCERHTPAINAAVKEDKAAYKAFQARYDAALAKLRSAE